MSKNILFINHVSFLGGAERYMLSLVEALDKEYKVFFICQEPGPLSEALEKKGVMVEYMRLGAWRRVSYLVKNFLTIQSIIRFCKNNQIHLICSNNYRVTSYAVWPAKVLGIPSVTIIQDFVTKHKLWKFNTFQSNALISVSQSISDSVSKYFSGEVTRIYNGIDAQAISDSLLPADTIRNEFPVLKGKKIIGMVAQVVPLKGHKLFLRAMQKVSEEFKDAMFVMIGASPDDRQLSLDDIKAYAKELGILDRIICTGSRDNVFSLIKSFDILVHPSYKEPFGRVIMEAMALSIPVVATASGGPSEIIEDGQSGILVPVGDEKRLADAVGELLRNDDTRRMIGKNGRKRIEQFNLLNTVEHVNNVFRKMLIKMQ